MLDPDGATYLQVPYRTLSQPPISAWEQRAAVARLREQGRAQVDEDALFRMVGADAGDHRDRGEDDPQGPPRRERRSASPPGPPPGVPGASPPGPGDSGAQAQRRSR